MRRGVRHSVRDFQPGVAADGGHRAAIGAGPRWFQLYWSARNELTASFIERAEQAGYEAIVVTLDTTMLGWRVRDLDRGYLPFLRGRGIANYTSDPVFEQLPLSETAIPSPPRPGLGALKSALELLRSFPDGPVRALSSGAALAAVRRFLAIYSRPDLTWDDLPFLRERTRLPILLKGILHPDDALRAVAGRRGRDDRLQPWRAAGGRRGRRAGRAALGGGRRRRPGPGAVRQRRSGPAPTSSRRSASAPKPS